MDSYITSRSKTPRGRKGRNTTSAALTFVLLVGLRVSLVTDVFACGHLWAAGEPRPIYRRTDVPGISTRHTYDAISRPLEKMRPVEAAAVSQFSGSAPLILTKLFGPLRDRTIASLSAVRAAVYRPWGGMPFYTGSLRDARRLGPVYFDTDGGFQRAYDQNNFFARGREIATSTDLSPTGSPHTPPPNNFGVASSTDWTDPQKPRPYTPACWDSFAPSPGFCRSNVSASGLSLAGRVRLVSRPAGGGGAGGGASGHHNSGAAPGQDLFKPYAKNLSPYFRICTSDMITPVPFKLPGTRVKACAMACKCDDGAFGIGLYTTKRLASLCSIAAESICPWQIKTISPSSPVGLTLPMQFTDSQIVACRLLESRPWE